MKCKTQRSNVLNSDEFPRVYFLRSNVLSGGQSLTTAIGQAVDTVFLLAHWADQPGHWELKSYTCHEYETGHVSPFIMIFVFTQLCYIVAALATGAGNQMIWPSSHLEIPFQLHIFRSSIPAHVKMKELLLKILPLENLLQGRSSHWNNVGNFLMLETGVSWECGKPSGT